MKPNNSMFMYIREHGMIDSLINYCAYMHILTRLSQEFEAEKTCELIMNSLGFEFEHSDYYDDYKINGKEPDYDLGVVIAAADQFLSWINESAYLRNLLYEF